MDTTRGYRCEYPGGWFSGRGWFFGSDGQLPTIIDEDGPCSNSSLYKEDLKELVKDGEIMLFCPACASQIGRFGWEDNADGNGEYPKARVKLSGADTPEKWYEYGKFEEEETTDLSKLLDKLESTYDLSRDIRDDLGFFDTAFSRDEGLDLVHMKTPISEEEQAALDAAEKAKDKKTTPNRTVSAKEAILLLDASHQKMQPAIIEDFGEPEWEQGNFLELMYSVRMMGTYKLTDMQKRELRLARKRRKASR